VTGRTSASPAPLDRFAGGPFEGRIDGRPSGGLTPAYVAAGALSVALTTLVLTLLALPHPPAGATTLLVSLSILVKPADLLDLAGAVVLITVAGWVLNQVLLGRRRT
jgi:hypothetical protein